MKRLDLHISIRFLSVFSFCILGVIVIFIVVDLVENADRFIDMHVPWHLVAGYYIFYTPYIVVLTMPMATLLATSILIGNLARYNELVAMKALGYSYYQILILLLWMGLGISVLSFGLTEGVVAPATRRRVEMERDYLKKHLERDRSRYRDLKIQEPPNLLITMAEFSKNTNLARDVKIETYDGHHLVKRIDTPCMMFNKGQWIITSGYMRIFEGLEETACPIQDTLRFDFQFSPKELTQVKITPEEMSVFELYRFAMRIRDSGGEIYKWMTDLHLRVAFPLSNVFVVFLCIPMVYNRRKKSLAAGVGISLLICFFYFGLVKTGQTFGHKRELSPLIAAWMGNGLAFLAGIYNQYRVRK